MTKRPGAVALVAGALFALCGPGAAVAQDRTAGEPPAREVPAGHVDWSTAEGELAGRGVSLGVTAPAVQAAGGARFPVVRGDAGPGSGVAEVELGGAARLDGPAERPLVLAGLRLELTGDEGALYARTVVDGRADELALAEVAAPGAGPAVRVAGVTWTGLRASLTEDGAALLSAWSGSPFAAGDGLGEWDVTVGTVFGPSADATPQAAPGTEPPRPAPEEKPAAAVAHPLLAAGGEQTVTGTGFAPGAVVLVAIDGDTRYQAVADAEGRVARTFPVYTNAVAGEHAVDLTAVSGERGVAGAVFEVKEAV
ncbi:hypothetical protein ACIBBD_38270 [Streptomyces sp. NPDC051315]|uniref:hypothetical protein n=1 Tax=Streptomyces sp. NPDC051315 TaxID=3365650 RepID=UPI0037A2E70B